MFLDKDGKVLDIAKSRRHEDLKSEQSDSPDFIVELAGWKSELKVM